MRELNQQPTLQILQLVSQTSYIPDIISKQPDIIAAINITNTVAG